MLWYELRSRDLRCPATVVPDPPNLQLANAAIHKDMYCVWQGDGGCIRSGIRSRVSSELLQMPGK